MSESHEISKLIFRNYTPASKELKKYRLMHSQAKLPTDGDESEEKLVEFSDVTTDTQKHTDISNVADSAEENAEITSENVLREELARQVRIFRFLQ